MTKVDMWLGTTIAIHIDNTGKYYVTDCGAILAGPFATLSAAQWAGKSYIK